MDYAVHHLGLTLGENASQAFLDAVRKSMRQIRTAIGRRSTPRPAIGLLLSVLPDQEAAA